MDNGRSMRNRARVIEAARRHGWDASMDGKDRMILAKNRRVISVNWYPGSDEMVSAFEGTTAIKGLTSVLRALGRP